MGVSVRKAKNEAPIGSCSSFLKERFRKAKKSIIVVATGFA
jgi:ABC-type molybdenum transport system ATPase subunit/photorepair protein PhrA